MTLLLIGRYNSVYFHSIPFNAGDSNKYSDWHWNSVLRWRHGAQCVYLAKGEDDGVQLHEATAAASHAPPRTAQQHLCNASSQHNTAINHLSTNATQPVDELSNQYNS